MNNVNAIFVAKSAKILARIFLILGITFEQRENKPPLQSKINFKSNLHFSQLKVFKEKSATTLAKDVFYAESIYKFSRVSGYHQLMFCWPTI